MAQVELEGLNSHLVILDIVNGCNIKQIINIYRCFNPQGIVTPREMFKYQLSLIKNAMIPKTVVLGDFNLDYGKLYDDNYACKHMFDDFENELSDFDLIQMVVFETWSRMVGPVLRSSTLNHICVVIS